jgi:prepilin-type N-terminal cleavage/methylation domain-containing protein
MSQPPPSQGFTLVEVLVALATVAVLVTGAAGLLLSAGEAIRMSRLSTTATLLAAQKVEQLRAATDATPGAGQDYFSGDMVAAPSPLAAFTRRWTVTPGWGASADSAVVVEVLARGVGRVVELHAVVHRPVPAGGSEES